MDTNNWRPTTLGSEGMSDGGDWRVQMLPESRSRIINKIMDTLKRHTPFPGSEGMNELRKIASRFEEKIYTSATSQTDYLRKISVKMLTMDTKSHANGMPTNPGGNGSRPPDAGMQPQVQNQVQRIPNSLGAQSQAHHQMVLQNNLPSSTVQRSGSLSTALPPGGQTFSMHNMQNISKNALVNAMAQDLDSSMFVGQRQIPGRQQVVPEQQQQSQNPQQQQMFMKQKMQQASMSHQMMTNQIKQQKPQQQNMLQSVQLTHQQSVMQQPTAIQQGAFSGMQHNQQSTQSMLLHHQQPGLWHQQQSQQAIHQQQQQQQLTSQEQTVQTTQFSSQQNMGEMQQQLMSQKNNLHAHQLAPQTNESGLHQQQPLMGTQSSGQHPVHMLQSSKAVQQQQMQSGSSNMLQSQGQQPQLQTIQQQLMSQIQSQPGQLQQQAGLPQQQQTSLQQRVQPPGSLLQQQNVIIDQEKQMFQSQRALHETSMDTATSQPTHASGGDWQEELHEKIKAMKDSYFTELNATYQRIALKLQQHDALAQQPKSDQVDKLRVYKTVLERLLSIMQCPKQELSSGLRDKLDQYEKQIVNLININKPRRPGMMQQNQIHPHHMSSRQSQQSNSQTSQVSSHENQMNPQMQLSTSVQNQVQSSSISSVSNPQQIMMNSLQHNPSIESGQRNAMGSMQQQVGVRSMKQQNSVSSAQQMSMSSQSGLPRLQPNVNNLQTNMGMLQHQKLKQHQEQHMLQTQLQQQQFKQMQHPQIMLPKQQHIQQQHAKQQFPTQLQTHQMNEVADVKLRPNMGVKGVFQHQPPSPRPLHAQTKQGSSLPISSPQILQAQSPQLSQHSSPQIDQQNMLACMTKIGTPLQSANSPLVIPSASTPLAASPLPGDQEKSISVIQPHSSAGNLGHGHINSSQTVTTPSPAIGTPGISASPLLAEFSDPDGGAHGHPLAAVSSKSTLTELPIERLMRVVKSLPSQSLSDAVTEISSVVSMVDKIAGAAPGNGSRSAVGEDLVAMAKCRLQARNVMLHDGPIGSRKKRWYTSAISSNAASSVGSVNDSFKRSIGAAEVSDLESTATSSVKRPRLQGNYALVEQIKEINQKLLDTVVDISDEKFDTCAGLPEGGDGVIVRCSFQAVSLSPELKSLYTSAQLSPIPPLRLLVPSNYPNCSPVLLDKYPVEVSGESEHLSVKVEIMFSKCLRSLSQPMSLHDIARTWDDCCHAAILECAEKNGGGSLRTKYGTWESIRAA